MPDEYLDGDPDLGSEDIDLGNDDDIQTAPNDNNNPNTNLQTGQNTNPPQTLTLEQAMGKLSELEAQHTELQPLRDVYDRYGGIEGIQPAIELFDALTGDQLNAQKAMEVISTFAPDAYPQLAWGIIDAHLDTITTDPQIRQAVLSRDADYQEYLQWRANGGTTEQFQEQLDPNNPLHAELIQARKDREEMRVAQQQFQQAQQLAKHKEVAGKVEAYDNQQLDWLKTEVAKFNWGDEHKDLMQDVIEIARTKFDQDPQAMAALQRARRAHVTGNAQAITSATKVVRNHLARHLKAVTERFNKVIKTNHVAKQTTFNQQQQNRHLLPGGSNGMNGASGATPQDPYERAQARLDAARAKGLIPGGYNGY